MLRAKWVFICWLGCHISYSLCGQGLHLPAPSQLIRYLVEVDDSLYYQLKDGLTKEALAEQARLLEKSYAQVVASDSPLGLSRWYRLSAQNYFLENDFAFALHQLSRAMDIPEIDGMHYPHDFAGILREKAWIYENLGLYDEALNLLREVATTTAKQINLAKSARLYLEISSLEYKAGLYQEGMHNVAISLDFWRRAEDSREVASGNFFHMSALNTAGLLSEKLGLLEEALIYYQKAEAMAKALENEFWKALINGNKSMVLYQLKRTDEALALAGLDYRISAQTGAWSSAIKAACFLSNIYVENKEYGKAKIYLDSAHAGIFKIQEINYNYLKLLEEIYQSELLYYKAIGDKNKTIEVLEKLISNKEKSGTEELSKRIQNAEMKINLTKRQGEIDRLTKENKLRSLEINRQKYIGLIILLFLFFLSVLAAILWNNNRKKTNNLRLILSQQEEILSQKEELEAQGNKLMEAFRMVQELNEQLQLRVEERTKQYEQTHQDLDLFLYRLSHDTRRPLTTLMGLIQLLELQPESEEKEVLELVKTTIRSMDGMLSKLQMIHHLNGEVRSKEEVNVTGFLEEILEKLRREFSLLPNQIKLSCDRSTQLLIDPLLLQIIVVNLVENACFYSINKKSIQIEITITQEDKNFCLQIKDAGVGIDPEILPQIFDLYFRGTEMSKGNGLGLYLVQLSVAQLAGEIKVESTPGQGSTFTVVLPISVT
jgi:signal transduction histidine kinase